LRLAVTALIVGAAFVVPAAETANAGAAPPRVVLYGDSVLSSGALPVAARVEAHGWTPHLVAYAGADVGQMANVAFGDAHLGDVVVMTGGYTYFWKPWVLGAQIDKFLSVLSARGVHRVIWLNLREARGQFRDVNQALSAAARRWKFLDLADWNAFTRDKRAAFEADGYHLRPAGGALMGALIAQRLAAYRAGAPRVAVAHYGARLRMRPVVRAYRGTDATAVADRLTSISDARPFVGLASTPDGRGAWLVDRGGGVLARGDASNFGSVASARRTGSIVGIASTPSGRGYWVASSDGSVYAFGDAPFRGGARKVGLRAPVVGIASTRSGHGYWLVAADGGVFSFGDARFYGSTGALRLDQPIVGIAAHPGGRGYWLVAYDGGVFAFGAARFYGSAGTGYRYWKIEGIAPTSRGNGYWLLDACGNMLSFNAPAVRTTPGTYEQLFVAIAPRPRDGVFVLGQGT
jgi:hypothetical protein